MNLQNHIFIFSVFTKNASINENVAAHGLTFGLLEKLDLPVKELNGMYQGQEEKSILIVGEENRSIVEEWCKTFNQECYLQSYNDRYTELVFLDGNVRHIGKLMNVSKDEALAYGNWSKDKKGQYYVTR